MIYLCLGIIPRLKPINPALVFEALNTRTSRHKLRREKRCPAFLAEELRLVADDIAQHCEVMLWRAGQTGATGFVGWRFAEWKVAGLELAGSVAFGAAHEAGFVGGVLGVEIEGGIGFCDRERFPEKLASALDKGDERVRSVCAAEQSWGGSYASFNGEREGAADQMFLLKYSSRVQWFSLLITRPAQSRPGEL
jgi:hypothetical protein